MGLIAPPEPLRDDHELDAFRCGVASLDDWLKKRARVNHAEGASRSYVIAAERRIIGYYALASGAIAAVEATGNLRRNMPDPIPMAVLGRLAIDQAWQSKGIGVTLLQDAVRRALQAADILGIRGLLVHAISDEAGAFYEHHGFVPSPANPMTLFLSLKGLR